MFKYEKQFLEHIKPIEYGYDTDAYFVSTYFKGKDSAMYNLLEKVENWVVKNGGVFKQLSDRKYIKEQKGYIVQIRFPSFGKRDMKNIMATLY